MWLWLASEDKSKSCQSCAQVLKDKDSIKKEMYKDLSTGTQYYVYILNKKESW
jgi:hypothetical protein